MDTVLAETSYFFSISQPLSFSAPLSGEVAATDNTFSFEPYLMIVDGTTAVDVSGLFDRTHFLFNRKFKSLFHRLDEYFGDDDRIARGNQSWARVRIDSLKSTGENPEVKAGIKLRVVLPRAERRFRLLFSTEDESTTGRRDRAPVAGESEGDDYSLALRFNRRSSKNGSVDFDLGTRYRDRMAQIFGRINLRYSHDFLFSFRSTFSNSLYYYSASGYENTFRYDLVRPIKGFDTLAFRGSTEVRWKENYRGAVIGETVGIYAEIDSKRSMAVEGLGFYTTALNNEQTKKYLGAEFRIRYRHNIWRRWFFYEVWPTISWRPVNDYTPSFGGMFRIEMALGDY